MAMKAPTIMSMVTETDVTDRIKLHSNIIVYLNINMNEQGGFFDVDITD